MIGASVPASPQTYDRGLAGLVAGDTRISAIDGERGRLCYRGYAVEDLAAHLTFEEVTHLVLFGELPDAPRLAEWTAELVRWRRPPPEAFAALARVPRVAHPLAKYRTMLSVAACFVPEAENTDLDAQWRRPARILSWAAALAAGALRHVAGAAPLPPRDDLGYGANFLWQALGLEPAPSEARAFDVSLIVQAEHGLHAAALAALTVIATGADLGSAVLAGMGALSGARHGGANQLAFEMIAPLTSPAAARTWVEAALRRRYRFPGFGHRVYNCPDPRVAVLEPYAKALLEARGETRLWDVWKAVREAVEAALSPKGVYANVDAVTGLLYHPLGLPPSAFPIPFCLAIETGWMAHCLEYLPDGPMLVPAANSLECRA